MRDAFDLVIRAFCWGAIVAMFGFFFVACTTNSDPIDDWLDTDEPYDAFEDQPVIEEEYEFSFDEGGTTPIIEMPFESGYASLCTQGVSGGTSHHSSATMYDIDFDTSNTVNEPLLAPVSGTAYVHKEDASKNFGNHVSIHIGNGMYVIIAHMSLISVFDGQQVVAGQFIGYEGCTGYCSGDHVHIGLHSGDARKMGQFGTSLPVRYHLSDKTAKTGVITLNSSAVVCGVKGLGDKINGHVYTSALPFVAVPQPNSRDTSSNGNQNPPPTSTPSSTTSQTSSDDVWTKDVNLDGKQEALMMSTSRWSNTSLSSQDAYVFGAGGCFDGNLTESDRIYSEYGYYKVDFSKFESPCTGSLTLISASGTDGKPPNSMMSNWSWWQNSFFCSAGSKFCELQKNGTNWEEWMIQVSWNPSGGLKASGNGFTKNVQLK